MISQAVSKKRSRDSDLLEPLGPGLEPVLPGSLEFKEVTDPEVSFAYSCRPKFAFCSLHAEMTCVTISSRYVSFPNPHDATVFPFTALL